MIKNEKHKERAILVGIEYKGRRWEVNDHLDELEQLADTADGDVIERVIQARDRIDPAYMIGRGKIHELAQTAKYLDADVIIFDDDLSPAQAKNIENVCKTKIIDRSALILDIFARHARTREARTQVELAQLKYLLPRLTRQWTHLSRQVGGIGVRGPGETQLEVDRRMIRKRISLLETELEKISKQRKIRRKRRGDIFKIALVGYTNVGKSTLMNALTNAEIRVENQLFATLDSTIRSMESSEKILLIDTVGFIRKLPHHLIASFKSTLEEAHNADMLMHVIDSSHPHFEDQIETVKSVLHELQIDKKPRLNVFNKIDCLDDFVSIQSLRKTYDPSVFVSAKKGIFLNQLQEKLKTFIQDDYTRFNVTVPLDRGDIIAKLHSLAKVLDIECYDNQVRMEIESSSSNTTRVKQLLQEI